MGETTLLLDLHLGQFWQGLGLGLLLGVIVGATWENAYEMVTKGLDDRHLQNRSEARRMDLRKNWLAILLAITSLTLIMIGVFQVYSYTKFHNFVSCQATYNQQAAEARAARVGVTDKETDLLFVALRDNITAAHKIDRLPADQQEAKGEQLKKRLLQEFHAAVKAHEERIASATENPYPPDPVDTCGRF